MRCETKKHKLNNAGSAIVTVLVVVTFIMILATVLLYISGRNYQMKVTDYHTKESFYQAETPVEELRAQLVKDVQIAFAKAYTAAMSEYAAYAELDSDEARKAREANYRQRFCDELDKIWKERCGLIPDSADLINWEAGIRSVLSPAVNGNYWDVEVAAASGWDTSRAVSAGQVILQGVTFTYDSASHYSSIISTDYCVTIPKVGCWSENYDAEGSVEEMLDFSDCINYMNWTKR